MTDMNLGQLLAPEPAPQQPTYDFGTGYAPEQQNRLSAIRLKESTARAGQLEDLGSMLDQRNADADNLYRLYRDAGLGEAAARYREASRRSSQALARRGLTGGSADFDSRIALNTQAESDAMAAEDQATAAQIQERLAGLSDYYSFGEQAQAGNPFMQDAETALGQSLSAQANMLRRIYGLNESADAARRGTREAEASSIFGGLSQAGKAFRAGWTTANPPPAVRGIEEY